ncbi:hypothetical protein BSL78_05344 [Apostichopus japonicus]|uniref:CUB domain-containing protein n=1 Tax=Stichopus japonicus TaxID=307972 RepID=A0A2G8LBU6_STIJA|nr:hypothetical protein BSL78_05344 [Apostichopus japonicus]
MLWSLSYTVNLLQDIGTDFSFVSDYNTVYWVGWSLIPPDSLGILITFNNGTTTDGILSIGTDLEDTIVDYQFPADEPLGNIFVNSSAWIVLSIPRCYGTLQQSITVSAADAKDFLVCEGFVYRELDVCNNDSSCENGADESGCVTATLDLDETIMFPLLTTTSKDESIDMIWSIVMSSDARALIRLDGSLSRDQTLEFGSGVWETGKSIELTMNYQNSTDDLLLPWNSFWIRYNGYDNYYYYGSSVDLVVTAVNGDDIMVCDVSYLVINQTMICDGQPFCPYSDDEIGCEIKGGRATLQTTSYPGYVNSITYQRWEYFTTREDVSMIVHFRELTLDYSTGFYAGIGSIAPENASVDYRPAADCYLTPYDPIQDLYLESNMIWIAIASDNRYGLHSTRMWAEILVVGADEEILRCEDGRHIATSDLLCDNLWACDDGDDEIGCEATPVGYDDVVLLMSQPQTTSSILRLSSPDEQIFVVKFEDEVHSSLRIGSGTNFSDPDSLLFEFIPYRDHEKLIYINNTDIWITLEESSYRPTSVNITVIYALGIVSSDCLPFIMSEHDN